MLLFSLASCSLSEAKCNCGKNEESLTVNLSMVGTSHLTSLGLNFLIGKRKNIKLDHLRFLPVLIYVILWPPGRVELRFLKVLMDIPCLDFMPHLQKGENPNPSGVFTTGNDTCTSIFNCWSWTFRSIGLYTVREPCHEVSTLQLIRTGNVEEVFGKD